MISRLVLRTGLLALVVMGGGVFAADGDIGQGDPTFEAQLRIGFKQSDLEAALNTSIRR